MNKNKLKRLLRTASIIIIISVLIVLFKINVDSNGFWAFDFYEIIYLCIIIFISFFLTQHYTDERKRKDYIIDMVNKVSNYTLSINLDKIIEDKNSNFFVMEIRNIRNTLDLLNEIAIKYEIKDEVKYLQGEIAEIDNTVSENLSNIENLRILKTTIERHKNNVGNKCDAVKFKIFFPKYKKKK